MYIKEKRKQALNFEDLKRKEKLVRRVREILKAYSEGEQRVSIPCSKNPLWAGIYERAVKNTLRYLDIPHEYSMYISGVDYLCITIKFKDTK